MIFIYAVIDNIDNKYEIICMFLKQYHHIIKCFSGMTSLPLIATLVPNIKIVYSFECMVYGILRFEY